MPFKRTETGLESVLVGIGEQIPIETQKRLKKANSDVNKDGLSEPGKHNHCEQREEQKQ